jgi:GTPase SAR1 family protein
MNELGNAYTNASGRPRLDGVRQSIAAVQQLLTGLPRTDVWQTELAGLCARLANEEKLVAVFGAFSTGKSSLINAMLGESVLVVSPNPTTAAITEVHAAPAANAASQAAPMATIHMKTAEQLWEDVSLALTGIQQSASDLREAAELAAALKPRDIPAGKRKTLTFLKAFASGFAELGDRLGATWTMPAADASRFCAEERYACFVQRVELAQPTARLGQRAVPGLVLVDTPGVDSIHRRHTDVAFRYMRQADAIVFVLYYTHALSRAEKDFLLQLAQVQDVVGSEKLFVVINAVDLATSSEERQAVRERVLGELRQLGIRQPRVYEVSSQLAFAARQWQYRPDHPALTELLRTRLHLHADAPLPEPDSILTTSGLPALEDDLARFVESRYEEMAVDAVRRSLAELRRHGELRLAQLQTEKEQSEAERREQAAKQQALWDRLKRQLDVLQAGDSESERALRSEAAELAFHAGERIRFRFSSLFREAFYPGRFRGPGSVADQLAAALAELVEALQRQVELECRTLALRLEAYAERLFVRDREQLMTALADVGRPDLMDVLPTFAALGVADESYRSQLRPDPFVSFLKKFHSPKAFFEGGGQEELLADLGTAATDAVREELSKLAEPMLEEAVTELRRQYEGMWSVLLAAGDESDAEARAAGQSQLDGWRRVVEEVDRLTQTFRGGEE